VGVAQLVERLVVVQVVAGSSPVTHPNHRSNACMRPSKITRELNDAYMGPFDSPLIFDAVCIRV
jgi:hypothetical protein